METAKAYLYDLVRVFRKPRSLLGQSISLGCVVFSALMVWRSLMVFTGSESPVVVVLSGSMEPAFYRGDILVLTQPAVVDAGDVVVYNLDHRNIPIVHRVMNVHHNETDYSVLTKGDNNNVDDRGLYAQRQLFLTKQNVMGVARLYAPYAGMLTIWMSDYPWLKVALLGSMALFVLIGKE